MATQLQPRTIEVNGAELHYVDHGQGDPVLFVHGSVSDYRSWAFQMGIQDTIDSGAPTWMVVIVVVTSPGIGRPRSTSDSI